ncbi:cell wall-associated NlpC family hydrolase [Nonomuraea thailandensis]|uniref:Cell wall-associated NlpC family hydrolase n=1 Tax=Nonomuraea thailandensis TaxID=1188745 RepID=A0A9X2H1Z3_9ACTN|nr:C40 family peptidase [Nonomuraea thailandensis]MCP2364498.1 cell wall-associated NlpC family hydrolase [Nonomuraea thailandensis]
MPFIVVTLVAVLTADVLLLTQPDAAMAPVDEAVRATPRQTPLAQKRPVQQQPAVTTQPVQPLSKLHKPNLFVLTSKPFTNEMLQKVARLSGVRALELADAASVTLDGKRVQTLAVNPSTFRSYTPKVTASSDALWQNVAAGDVAVSFVLGNDGGLSLHSRVSAGSAGQLRIGAYATTGFGAVDAVVSKQVGRSLGLPRDNALIVSAPKANSDTLRKRIMRALGKGTQVAMVNPVLPQPQQKVTQRNWPAGSFMTGEQLTVALKAAVSKLGRPYVWGAEGPETFDCSGLVQWAYGQAGVRMPRVTHQQWVTGPQVPYSQAVPGDLLFWRNDPTNPDYISHVAIYWGDGKMLHAPRTGDVVKIAPVSTRNLAGVVRVSPIAAGKVR